MYNLPNDPSLSQRGVTRGCFMQVQLTQEKTTVKTNRFRGRTFVRTLVSNFRFWTLVWILAWAPDWTLVFNPRVWNLKHSLEPSLNIGLVFDPRWGSPLVRRRGRCKPLAQTDLCGSSVARLRHGSPGRHRSCLSRRPCGTAKARPSWPTRGLSLTPTLRSAAAARPSWPTPKLSLMPPLRHGCGTVIGN